MFAASQIVKTKLTPTNLAKTLSPLSYSTGTASAPIDSKQLKSADEIPGPKSYPIIGNLLELKAFGKE